MSMSPLEYIRSLGPGAKASLVALVVVLIMLIWTTPPMLTAMLAPELPQVDPLEGDETAGERFARRLEADQMFINDRSLFFTPREPTFEPEPDPVPIAREDPPPTSYDGPPVVGVMADRAYFAEEVLGTEKALAIGQRGRGRSRSLEVLKIQGSMVSLRWANQDFDVDIFADTNFEAGGGFAPSNNSLFQPAVSRGASPNQGGFNFSQPANRNNRNSGTFDLGLQEGGNLFQQPADHADEDESRGQRRAPGRRPG